jgi:iron-sulfur cluster repair protein YtfE (RIC family)
MRNKLSLLKDRYVYRARGLVESVSRVIEYILHAQHTRHRGQLNSLANLMAALCAYQLRAHQPAAAVRGLA